MARKKAGQTRDSILEAAVELFVRDGFAATSMDAIAASAGLAKGSLYYHYMSKEGIVDAIIGSYKERLTAALAAIEAEPGLDTLARLSAFVVTLKDINKSTFARLHRVKYIDIHDKTAQAMLAVCTPFYARLLEDGTRKGLWKAEHPRQFARITMAAGIFLFDPEYGTGDFEGDLAAFLDMSAKTLGVDPAALVPLFDPPRAHPLPGNAGQTA